jgi:hypothetical protein
MVRIENPNDFKLLTIEKSHTKNKKYDGILQNKQTGKIKRVPFGDQRYQHFKDRTGLKMYSHLDHNDDKRRKNYLARHAKNDKFKFSSAWFSSTFLWVILIYIIPLLGFNEFI